MNHQGLFITFEGGDGVGKSTQVHALQQTLHQKGYKVLATREPGGTDKAEKIRAYLMDPNHPLTLEEEIEGHFRARKDHVQDLIKPVLGEGYIVLCDRFTDSSYVYQGYLRGKGSQKTLDLIAAYQKDIGLTPDRTYLLRADKSILLKRLQRRQQTTNHYRSDRYEEGFLRHFQIIEDGFKCLAHAQPQRIKTLDTSHCDARRIHNIITCDIDALLRHNPQ